MSEHSPCWYVVTDGQQPAGPFTAEQLIQSWQAGRLDANTPCWREGMPQWLPLWQVEPFASRIAVANRPPAVPPSANAPHPPQYAQSPGTTVYVQAPPRRSDPCGVTSMILGILSLVAIVVGCLGCGVLGIVTYPLAAMFATIGILFGSLGRGNLRAAGIVLNLVALLPAILLAVAVFTGGTLLGLGGAMKSHFNGGLQDLEADRDAAVAPMGSKAPVDGGRLPTPSDDEVPPKLAVKKPSVVRPIARDTGGTPEATGPEVPPGKTLDDTLRKAKITIDTSAALYNAVANRDLRIIEIADTCTAEQFDAEQTRLLREWIREGGVLWVNSSVLDLLGVRHSTVSGGSFANCVPATGSHPILEGVSAVRVEDLEGKALTLSYRGVIPLLAVKHEGRNPYWEPPAGTAVWSLVPYGKGWISDPKPLNLSEDGNSLFSRNRDRGQSALFWGRFCQFCLREIPWPNRPAPPDGETEPPGGDGPVAEKPRPQGPLSGTWERSAAERFRIEDDGKTLSIELISNNPSQSMAGTLVRRDDEPDTLSGSFALVYPVEPKRHTVEITATIKGPDCLHISCSEFPRWARKTGEYLGKGPLDVDWTRSSDASPAERDEPRVDFPRQRPDDPFGGVPGMSEPAPRGPIAAPRPRRGVSRPGASDPFR